MKGALASSVLDKSKNFSAYAENAFSVRPNLAVVVGTQFLHATRDAHRPLPVERRPVRPHRLRPLEPEGRPPLGCDARLAGLRQRLAQRRGADLRRQHLHVARRTRTSRRRPRPPSRSARAAAARTSAGTSRSTAPSPERAAVPDDRRSCGSCTVSNADRTIASGRRGGARSRAPASPPSPPTTASGSTRPTPTTTSSSTATRCMATTACRGCRRTSARRDALQRAARLLRRAECRVDAAGLLRGQRQQPHRRSLYAAEPAGGYRRRASAGPL